MDGVTKGRVRLEGAIPKVTDAEWAALERKGHARELEEDLDDASLHAAVSELKELRNFRREEEAAENSPPPAEPSYDPAKLARRAADRSEALGALLAADAGRREEVVRLRRELLRGRLLKPERVGEWLKRRAAKGKPIEHLTLRLPLPRDERDIIERVGAGDFGFANGHPVVDLSRPQIEYVAHGPSGRVVSSVSSTEELEPLRRLSKGLAADYRWMPAAATEFLLSGFAPGGSSIRVRSSRVFPRSAMSRIELEIDPTLTPEEVKRRYATARKDFLAGRRVRRMSTKHLRLATFADSHTKGTWEQRMHIWNREEPDFSYSAPTNFQRDATAALRRLLDPFG